jgi:hypothetical protein
VSSLAVRAATPLTSLRYAPDITVDLSGTTITPAEVAEDDLAGMVTAVDIGMLPADTHVDAYALLGNDDQLLSFDTTVALPGGLIAEPADVVRFDGASYSSAFDASDNEIPEGVNVDAVALLNGDLLLSFDTTVRLDDVTYEDEDLAHFTGAEFVSFFTGATAGVSPDLDLDGAQVLGPQRLLVSFDGSGSIGGVAFNDDDVLEYDGVGDTWELAYSGSAQHDGWEAGDLVALHALLAEPSPTPTATSITPGSATPTATATTTSSTPGTATTTPVATETGSPATATATREATATVSPSLTPTTPSEVCVGDCDGDGDVMVNELVTMVNIALGSADVSTCLPGDPNGSGEITINELVIAVNNALNGC